MNPVTYHNGQASWTHQPGDKYVVTGVTTDGRRFKMVCASWILQARDINLYRGTKWLLRDGKKYRLVRVTN